MTNTQHSRREIPDAQANAYRQARCMLEDLLRAPDTDSLPDRVYRETLNQEIARFSDLEAELRRDATVGFVR